MLRTVEKVHFSEHPKPNKLAENKLIFGQIPEMWVITNKNLSSLE